MADLASGWRGLLAALVVAGLLASVGCGVKARPRPATSAAVTATSTAGGT